MTDQTSPRRTVRTMGGWPAMLALVVMIAAILYFTIGRQDRAVQLRPASGTAQAMFDGAHAKDTPASTRQ